MTQPENDASVLAHIQHLVDEEHRLFERSELGLRQRRALREFGGDPSQAHARDAATVKKYIG